jgi:hypothetical protein
MNLIFRKERKAISHHLMPIHSSIVFIEYDSHQILKVSNFFSKIKWHFIFSLKGFEFFES